jgi:hypothetical protein
MAIYHLSVKLITRTTGRSATAAAAYRAGEKFTITALVKLFDYTRKRSVLPPYLYTTQCTAMDERP